MIQVCREHSWHYLCKTLHSILIVNLRKGKSMKKWMNGIIALMTGCLIATSVNAAEWKFYGNARISTFFSDTETATGTSSTTYSQALQGNSRIGAKVSVRDDLKGRFEYGTSGGNANVRLLYGEWNFGAGSFLVGQSYTPIYTRLSQSVYATDRGLEKYGATSALRHPMLRLKFGGFSIAAIEPGTDALTGTTTEVSIPKVEMAYDMKFNNISIKAVAGYNAYEIDDAYDVNSYILGLGGKGQFGSAYLAASFYLGQNLGPYDFRVSTDNDPILSGTDEVFDNESFGYILVAGYKLNDMLSFEAGYGYTESELDQNGTQEDDGSQYYLQAKITLAPNVFIVPEVGVVNNGQDKTGAEQTEITYLGAKWQINF
ncbi:MAG TPA: hypothetical protein DHV36_22450 [Desulfobacteraceae bacterium]|nr:hypothetical protein [Desulfobacteraceae bacterium]